MKTETVFGWHFVNDTLRGGSPIPKNGVWLPKIDNILMCRSGYHGSSNPFDALKYAPGPVLCRCEYRGEIVWDTDKFVAQERRIIDRADVTELLVYFARMQAISVVHLWDAPDLVLDWLMTGDKNLRAAAQDAARGDARGDARDAARDAALAAAQDAAQDAALAVVQDAARGAARDDFTDLVYERFGISRVTHG